METKANYIVTGAFTLAVIVGAFGFIYWFQNSGGGGERDRLPRGVRRLGVGPAHRRRGAVRRRPGRRGDRACSRRARSAQGRGVDLARSRGAGARRHQGDARFPGADGAGRGLAHRRVGGCGAASSPTMAVPPTIYADPNAGADVTQAARNVLSRIDGLVADNETAMRASLRNIETVTATLAQNSERLNKVMAGLENLTGSGDNHGEIAQAAEAIRKLADNLDKRTEEISTGLAQFSNSGLKRIRGVCRRRPPHACRTAEDDQEHRPAPQPADLRALNVRSARQQSTIPASRCVLMPSAHPTPVERTAPDRKAPRALPAAGREKPGRSLCLARTLPIRTRGTSSDRTTCRQLAKEQCFASRRGSASRACGRPPG